MTGKIISHYRILEKLGMGGMGEVYKAEDLKLKRIAALKFLRLYFSRDEHAKQRFIQEAQNASSLDHPNICTIYEIDEIKDSPDRSWGTIFISMAYYEGATLKEKIRQKLISQADIPDIAIQVAKGLAKAHQQSIIHRDIKPENIMITKDDVVKILDFGLARLTGRTEITKPGMTMGTLSYISPEQIRGKIIDHRTDIWSFGVMLFEMLTGELPFKGEIDQAVIYSILNEAPEPFRIPVPAQLKKIIRKALEKKPDDRYNSMEEILTDLNVAKKMGGKIQTGLPEPSIAVLPFNNMSDDNNQEYLCDGIAEEIINALTGVKGLRIIARTSSFAFKGKQLDIREIGRKLNVDMILEGSVRKTVNRLRITAQLINVSDGCHIWSEKYDLMMEDVLAVQDEISLLIVDKLKIELVEEERTKITAHGTDNLEAYNLYLLGRYYAFKNSKADYEKAIEYFNMAAEKDDKFLMVYFWLLTCFGGLIGYYQSLDDEISVRAANAVNKALEIDPDAIPAHLALASFNLHFTRNWEAARAELEIIKCREPDNANMHHQLSIYYLYIADFHNAIIEEKLANQNDPLQVEFMLRLGVYYLRARRTEEARQQFLIVIELLPDFYYGYWMLGQTYILDSKFEKGIELLNKACGLSNEDELVLADLARAYVCSGNKDKAYRILERLKLREHLHPYTLTTLYSALDMLDEAFHWMEKTFTEKDPAFFNLLGAEGLDNLRKDPRFVTILKKYGFDKYYNRTTEAEISTS